MKFDNDTEFRQCHLRGQSMLLQPIYQLFKLHIFYL